MTSRVTSRVTFRVDKGRTLNQVNFTVYWRPQLNINLTDVDGGLQQAADGGWSTWTVYFIGFVVCASAGVVLSIVTPCVGLCIACCRCAGHCGSKIDPSDGRRAKCQRIGCGLALLVITAALVVAVVSVFALNERLRQQLRAEDTSSFDDVSRSIGDVESYLNGTTAEIQAEVIDRCSDHIDGLTAQAARLPDRWAHCTNNVNFCPSGNCTSDAKLRLGAHSLLFCH